MPKVKIKRRRRYYLYQMRGDYAVMRVPRRPPPPQPDPEPVPEPVPEHPTRHLEPAKVQRAVIARRYKGRRVLRKTRWLLDKGKLAIDES